MGFRIWRMGPREFYYYDTPQSDEEAANLSRVTPLINTHVERLTPARVCVTIDYKATNFRRTVYLRFADQRDGDFFALKFATWIKASYSHYG